MQQVSVVRSRILCAAIAAVGFGFLPANRAQAATTYYFDTNGAADGYGTLSGTYDWDDATNGGMWGVSGGTGATIGWTQEQFPRFAPTDTPTYTVTVSNNEKIAGMYASTAQNLTINAVGSGSLEIVGSTPQGLIGSGSPTVTINAPIVGSGAINPNTGGNWYLNGVNTYSGGTSLTSSGTLIHFNNSSSFGTGTITNNLASATAFVPLLAAGGATVTIPNNFVNAVDNSGINFGSDANTPVVSTGNWSLADKNLRLRNNGNSTSPLTLSGIISGTAGVILSGNYSGSITFSGANTYSGVTTVTGPGAAGAPGSTAVRLILGSANTIASSSSVALAGGILDTGGFTHSMASTTLALLTSTNASTIDFAAGASELDFANSSAVSWTGTTLNLTNWDPATDKLRFGTDSTGLTSDQLAKIEFNGAGLGTASLDANGYVVVPEPASLSLLGLGTVAVLARRRRA